jgi:hypothetical protein
MTSFEDLRTVNGLLYDTFQEAALKSGLIENEEEWIDCLEEAKMVKTGRQMRELFVSIIIHGNVTNYRQLWDQYKEDLVEDFIYTCDKSDPNHTQMCEQNALKEIDFLLSYHSKSLSDFNKMPQILSESIQSIPRLFKDELNYEIDPIELQSDINSLNYEQKQAYGAIISAYRNKTGGAFFVDGPGGTGKSFLFNTILANIRLDKKIALAVASSGVAALLLSGGRTAHSRFKIPLKINEDSMCNISVQSNLAQLIRETSLILWDESIMMSKYVFEALDRTVKDIFKTKIYFLMNLGSGTLPLCNYISENAIRIPPYIKFILDDINELIKCIYDDIANNFNKSEYLISRIVLTTENDTERVLFGL